MYFLNPNFSINTKRLHAIQLSVMHNHIWQILNTLLLQWNLHIFPQCKVNLSNLFCLLNLQCPIKLSTSDIFDRRARSSICTSQGKMSTQDLVSEGVWYVAVCKWLYKHEGCFDVSVVVDMGGRLLGRWGVSCPWVTCDLSEPFCTDTGFQPWGKGERGDCTHL